MFLKEKNILHLGLFCLLLCNFACGGANLNSKTDPVVETSKSPIKSNAKLNLLSNQFEFTEGPAVDKYGNVFFTDQPNNNIWKWDWKKKELSLYLENSGRSNGLYFDHQGNLLSCADEKFELWKIDKDKKVEVLTSNYEGKNLNGPNDLWVDPLGGIYFTDPYYQRPYWKRSQKEIPEERVYYLGAEMTTPVLAAENFIQPNGIIGSKNGRTLFVADIGANKTYQYEILGPGKLSERKLFCELGSDGMTLDHHGNLYLTGDGVTIFDKSGNQIEQIKVDEEWTANVTFGGKDQSTLFITAMGALYTLEMNVHGIR